jgi:transposase
MAAQHDRVAVEWLPAYAPELNPVEYIWGHLKDHEIPNVCRKNFWDLSHHARRGLRRMRRRRSLIRAFWVPTGLFD